MIGWAAVANSSTDLAASHLAKFATILTYLNTIPPENEGDLALILDGFDIWLQLPPEIMIQRYFAVNEVANLNLIKRFGVKRVAEHDLRQTILFGPDKVCWPEDLRRPACWAVPNSTLPENIYGADTDSGDFHHKRPRWLNSGTIIGPVGDLKQVFKAALAMVVKNHTTESDQFYFANVHAAQEYARTLLAKGTDITLPEAKVEKDEDKEFPVYQPEQKVEYHIGLDYESTLFLGAAFQDHFIAWFGFGQHVEQPKDLNALDIMRPFPSELPPDLESAPQPYAAVTKKSVAIIANDGIKPESWHNVSLATHILTHEVPALIHFTGYKPYRDEWWDRMWYFADADLLLRAGVAATKKPKPKPITVTRDGREWWNAVPPDPSKWHSGERGGAWSYAGEWLPWEDICGGFDDEVLGTHATS